MSVSAGRSTGSSKTNGRPTDALASQFELIRLDYERTLGLLDVFARTRTTLRGFCLSAYAALIGLGVHERSWAICASAAVLVAGFVMMDAYNGAQYRSALKRANDLERLFQARLRALDRSFDPYLTRRLRTAIERYQFGPLTHLPRTRVAGLVKAATRSVLLTYAVGFIAAVIAAVVVG